MREGAEKAKRELDGLKETNVNLPFITADQSGPKHLDVKITRAKFESMAEVRECGRWWWWCGWWW